MESDRVRMSIMVERAIERQERQTQGCLTDQLAALRVAANRLGLYDAADWLNYFIRRDQ